MKIITIDGTSGVGKGTASRLVATALGWEWLDSGALYRLTAYDAKNKNIDFTDVDGLIKVATNLDVRFVPPVDGNLMDEPDVILNGVVVNSQIRTMECGKDASIISKIQQVRDALLARQRAFLTSKGLVADGRDMGTVVFPKAPLKIFLQASLEVRANRRSKQLQSKGISVNIGALIDEIDKRDERDRNRTVAPTVPAADAYVIDTSQLSINEVCKIILDKAHGIFK